MKLVLLSTANVNRGLVAGARASGVAEVVAVAPRDAARAWAQADELGPPRAHGYYVALLADDVDSGCWAARGSTCSSRGPWASPAACWPRSTAASSRPAVTHSRSSARMARWFSTTRPTRAPVIEVRDGDGATERVEVEAPDPYACELQELAALIAGERPARFGREGAVAQARALAALHDAAGG